MASTKARCASAVIRSAAPPTLATISPHDARGRPCTGQAAARAARGHRVELDRDHLTASANELRQQRGVAPGTRADLKHSLTRAQRQPLQHRGHQRRRRGGARRHAPLIAGGEDRRILIDPREPFPLRDLRKKTLPRQRKKRSPHRRSLYPATALEPIHKLAPQPRAFARPATLSLPFARARHRLTLPDAPARVRPPEPQANVADYPARQSVLLLLASKSSGLGGPFGMV